jgi:hypothetical protein
VLAEQKMEAAVMVAGYTSTLVSLGCTGKIQHATTHISPQGGQQVLVHRENSVLADFKGGIGGCLIPRQGEGDYSDYLDLLDMAAVSDIRGPCLSP